MNKLVINCETGEVKKIELTDEEKQKIIEKQTEVKIQYPQVSQEKEQLALLIIENENLKDRIKNLENKIIGGN